MNQVLAQAQHMKIFANKLVSLHSYRFIHLLNIYGIPNVLFLYGQ